MNDKDYFSHLYEIASHLNKEFSLHSALLKSLEKTVKILDLESGWLWLTEPDNKSVYLAASYELPPALSNHPERLSGWCYCIEKYLTNDMELAKNISEIACSRLKDLKSGTEDLKFHATIPITINEEKVGLMNLLSKGRRQLTQKELTILNTIGELVGTAIQRTRLQQAYGKKGMATDPGIRTLLQRVLRPKLAAIISGLSNAKSLENKAILAALNQARQLQEQVDMLGREVDGYEGTQENKKEFYYPALALTKRELEVLGLIKQGLTNGQIGEKLFIAERTVKFHVTAILSKLGADTRTQAVDIALKRGLLGI